MVSSIQEKQEERSMDLFKGENQQYRNKSKKQYINAFAGSVFTIDALAVGISLILPLFDQGCHNAFLRSRVETISMF